MSPELIYGQYGAIVCLVIAVVHLYRENTALRKDSMELLRKYQDREDEERKLWISENSRRREVRS